MPWDKRHIRSQYFLDRLDVHTNSDFQPLILDLFGGDLLILERLHPHALTSHIQGFYTIAPLYPVDGMVRLQF